MNTPAHPDSTNDVKSSEQLLILMRTQAMALVQDTMSDATYVALERTITEWATEYGTPDNIVAIEKIIADTINTSFPDASNPRRPMMLAVLYKIMANGFMGTIESLKNGNDSTMSAATPAIQHETTETLGEVFSSGWGNNVPQAGDDHDFTLNGVRIDELA